MNQSDVLVSVCCITYNHAKYIRQCLDGLIGQNVNFNYEIIVHDDCSTDGTDKIVQDYFSKYPELIVPIFEESNQYQKGNRTILASFMLPKAKGKYIAICEGDDYWIDTYKLQKQVDFLERHEDYGMVYSKAKILCNDQIIGESGTSDVSFEGLITYSNFPTLTRVYRHSLLNKFYREIDVKGKGWLMGDYPIAFYFVAESKIKFLDECTAVYRLLEESASHSKDIDSLFRFYDSADDVRYFFVDRYITDEKQRAYYESLIKEKELEYKISMLLSRKKQLEARHLVEEQWHFMNRSQKLRYKLYTQSFLLYDLLMFAERVRSKIKKTWQNL